MCQSMQPSSNDDLHLFLYESFEIFPSLKKCITLLVILFTVLLAISQHIFAALAKCVLEMDFVMSPHVDS